LLKIQVGKKQERLKISKLGFRFFLLHLPMGNRSVKINIKKP